MPHYIRILIWMLTPMECIRYHVYDTDGLPSSFVDEMEATGHILEIDKITDMEPYVNNNVKCTSSSEVEGVESTNCYEGNEIDRYEDDNNNIEQDTNVVNGPESKIRYY